MPKTGIKNIGVPSMMKKSTKLCRFRKDCNEYDNCRDGIPYCGLFANKLPKPEQGKYNMKHLGITGEGDGWKKRKRKM